MKERPLPDFAAHALAAVTDGAEYLLETANRTAPIEEGTLIGSGTVTVDKARLKATVSYDTPYAIRQHEDTRLRHTNGRRSKWLEHTAREEATRIRTVISTRLKRAAR